MGHIVIFEAEVQQIDFEAWQFLNVSAETFYVHAIISQKSCLVEHLDGATMLHSDEQRAKMRAKACKIKVRSYVKHFRLDGHFQLSVAEALMDLYFPLDQLTKEFLNAPP